MKTLIFLPGLGYTKSLWNKVIENLPNDKYNLVTLDVPPYGTKYRNTILNFDTYPDWLSGQLNEAKTRPPHVLIGHSLGGYIALEYTIRYPDKVEKLILSSTPLRNKQSKFPVAWKILLSLGARFNFIGELTSKLVCSDVTSIRLVAQKMVALDPDFLKTSNVRSVCLCCLDLGNREWGKDVVQIDTPTLIAYGELDRAIKGVNGTELYKEFKTKKIISFPCNHSVPVYFPKELAKEIDTFVSMY